MNPAASAARVLANAAAEAHARGVGSLLARQHESGYWHGELFGGDTTLESDFILLELWQYPPVHGRWDPPSRPRIEKAVASILARQLPDGGFSIYPGGPADVSASVKAYFALKVAGVPAEDPRMIRLRERILSLGGIQAANSYVKLNLSFFGLYPRRWCPSVPPEMILLGNLIYQMSSWTRAIVIPLSIVHAANPRRPVPAGFDLSELYHPSRPLGWARDPELFSWRNFFLAADRFLKFWEEHGSRALRSLAIRKAERWMLERTRYSDGLGAIYPPMMYVIMALDVLGYGRDHPDRVEAERQFYGLLTDDGERFFFQPCFSPVWDTAIAAFALGARETPDVRRALRRAADWLLTKQVRHKGDWAIKRPRVEPGGWYFEFANEFYPDIDDTAMVLLALERASASDAARQQAAERRAINWLLAMQSSDGGWAAFDVDNDWTPLSHMPFADHNAMLDPTCPDITGRVLEALCRRGADPTGRTVRRAVAYLQRTQQPEGCWYGRWGVNYIYGTFLALRGLRAAGQSDREAHILRAAEWLRSVQNADGGWGESCASYAEGRFVPAPSTASQTAWALLGLLAAGDTASQSVQRGIEYLVETQRQDGTWHEDLATGTGFPGVYYLVYTLYRQSFPVLALAEFLERHRGE
ncbi:MAG: squalene--hopene cyclase [Bryobacterales bacterium]|nr:squalene--hopene cyclase [Bryobacteraceae bacterium]MDW8130519.1 squalene--hopene cyclase [Bryobacterales bacterium]